MKQVFIIHGGDSYSSQKNYLDSLKQTSLDYESLFKTQKWREWIADELKEADVLLPSFPNKQNAQFIEWKVYFEKLIPFFKNDVSLVGYSLGAMFLAKYLNEKPLKKKVKRIALIAPCHNDTSLSGAGSFAVKSAKNLIKSSDEIHLFHSKDDLISPFAEFHKFTKDLPGAEQHVFKDKGHFFQPTFPELLNILSE